MNNLSKDKLRKLIDIIKDKCKKINKSVTKRKRLLDFKTMMFILCHKNGRNKSYTATSSYIKCSKISNVTAQAICNKRKSIPSIELKQLNDSIVDFIHKNISLPINELVFIAVDGSTINLPSELHKKKNIDDNYNASNNKYYSIAKVSSLYDITNGVPIDYCVDSNMDERQLLIKQLAYFKPGYIAVCDRGYFSQELVSHFIRRNIGFILRMKNSYKPTKDLITSGKTDTLIQYQLCDKTFTTLRMITYKIGINDYYLLTTLIDVNKYPLVYIQDKYHLRWDIESDFRYDKSYLMMDQLTSKSKQFIEQDIYIHQFILIIEAVIRLLFFNSKYNKYKMNTANSIHVILDHLLELILIKKKTKKITKETHRIIIIMVGTITIIKKNRHYLRIRKRPYLKLNITFPKKRMKKKKRIRPQIKKYPKTITLDNKLNIYTPITNNKQKKANDG